MVAAAQAEDKERQQVQVEIAEWEQNMLTILPSLEACSNPCKQQVKFLFYSNSPSMEMCEKAGNVTSRTDSVLRYNNNNNNKLLLMSGSA